MRQAVIEYDLNQLEAQLAQAETQPNISSCNKDQLQQHNECLDAEHDVDQEQGQAEWYSDPVQHSSSSTFMTQLYAAQRVNEILASSNSDHTCAQQQAKNTAPTGSSQAHGHSNSGDGTACVGEQQLTIAQQRMVLDGIVNLSTAHAAATADLAGLLPQMTKKQKRILKSKVRVELPMVDAMAYFVNQTTLTKQV